MQPTTLVQKCAISTITRFSPPVVNELFLLILFKSFMCLIMIFFRFFVLVGSIYMLIFIVGALGNAIVIYGFTRNRKLYNTVSNSYIWHLAISDFIFVCTLPFWAVDYFNKHSWVFGTFMCKLCRSVSRINMYRLVLPVPIIWPTGDAGLAKSSKN